VGLGHFRGKQRRDELGDVARVRDRKHVGREQRPLALDVGALEVPQLATRSPELIATEHEQLQRAGESPLRLARTTRDGSHATVRLGVEHDEQIRLAQRRRLQDNAEVTGHARLR
jgi:hypothetical protein